MNAFPPSLPRRRHPRGFVSYTVVLAVGMALTILMIAAYNRSFTNQQFSAEIQTRNDYYEKEDSVLRSIVAATPNRAIRVMKAGSNTNAAARTPLTWSTIFGEALDNANARSSISSDVATTLSLTASKAGNTGDSDLATVANIFTSSSGTNGVVTSGLLSSGTSTNTFGTNYPVPLVSAVTNTRTRNATYPVISNDKVYGTPSSAGVSLPVATYSKFNLIPYPRINFGYATPGELFVAKRNWWSFTMDMANHDADTTKVAHRKREFVLSLYEIPSQLAISASSFMSLGQYASGQAWDASNVSIEGGVFAGRAEISGGTSLPSISSRRGLTLDSTATIGGQQFAQNPFTAGVRENYQITQGAFFPVSQASESGRVAFIPINRNATFFDRFDTAAADETNTLSPTTWNDYSVGARQTAMRLDIVDCASTADQTPTELRFSYLKNGVRTSLNLPLTTSPYAGLPVGYIKCCGENDTYNFGTTVVDLAYGYYNSSLPGSGFAYETARTGSVTFNNTRFGDPNYGYYKYGYYRPSYPWAVELLPSGQICLAFYPQRLPAFLKALNADDPAINNSISINVDYTTTTGSIKLVKPVSDSTATDYNMGTCHGLILQECADLSPFTKGFSLVTNMRLYIGDDFNTTATTLPANYPLTYGGKKYPDPGTTYYPPCSLFAPEKRYGVDNDPSSITIAGQMGSLAKENASTAVRPLDSKTLSGTLLDSSNVRVNLKPIRHPADLPPITMMNWLVVVEEIRPEFAN